MTPLASPRAGPPPGTGREAVRTCPLCEATCGLLLTIDDRGPDPVVTRIRGDRDDVFSKGFLCPKGASLRDLHHDPDRLRRPLVKVDGVHQEVTWDEAWARVAEGIGEVVASHGRGALATYLGNPGAHNLSTLTYNRSVVRAIGSRHRYSAATVDQAPKQVASGYLFGSPSAVAVPDIDRTDLLLILGANPFASNGSLCVAPDWPGRVAAIRQRGGRVVTVDPRRTRTVEHSDEWVPIRPGTDAAWLASVVHVLVADGLVDPGPHLAGRVDGLDQLAEAVGAFPPERTEGLTRVPAPTTRRLAHELAAAPRAVAYGRMGTTTTAFGTTTSWLVDVVNVLTGNLDRPGGAMFTRPAIGGPQRTGAGREFRVGRSTTRVRGLPEVLGELPVAALAEEITVPGEGRVRGLVTVAGNPVLSTPDSVALDAALDDLEIMVSVDAYLNETTRHADVVLPPPSPLQRSHYDIALLQFAVRTVANYSPPVLPRDEGQPDEWEILATLAGIIAGQARPDPAAVDEARIAELVAGAVADPASPVHGRDPAELHEALSAGGRRGPDRILDLLLRTGVHGDGFGARPGGLSLDLLLAHPHGVDLGPLTPRIDEVLSTPSGRIRLAHPVLVADLARVAEEVGRPGAAAGLRLIGRRDLRSNNSWMHNIRRLTKGRDRCTLLVHPDDAGERGLASGDRARCTTEAGSVEVVVEVTEDIAPGTVSLPHGWGHGRPGARLSVAAERPGVNANVLTSSRHLDPLSSTSVLNGLAVTVVRADPTEEGPPA